MGSDLFPAKKQMHDCISSQLFYSLAFTELDQHFQGDVNVKILSESLLKTFQFDEYWKCHLIKFEHFDRLFVVILFFLYFIISLSTILIFQFMFPF